MTLSAGDRDRLGAGLAVAAALAVVLLPAGWWPRAVAAGAVVALSVWVALQDLSDFTIPDGAVLGLAALGLAGRIAAVAGGLVDPRDAALMACLDLAVTGGGLWAVREIFYRRRGYDGLGFGDVKLGAAGGLLVGMAGVSIALFGAGLAGMAVLLLRHGRDAGLPTARLAFGTLLAPALALVFLLSPDPIAGGLP